MTVTDNSLIVLLLSRCYSARPRGVHPGTSSYFSGRARLRRL
jgi:hypothetical protein